MYPHNLKIIYVEQQLDSKDTTIIFFILKNIISLEPIRVHNHSRKHFSRIVEIDEIRIIVQFLSNVRIYAYPLNLKITYFEQQLDPRDGHWFSLL